MISIDSFDEDIYEEIKGRWDRVAKPLGSLGRFEEMTARIGAVQGSADIDVRKRAVVMMCADNGVVEEGISQSGQDVTFAVASWMGRGESSVCKMADVCGADTIPVDVGINSEDTPAGVTDRKVMPGTRNFAKEPAMTEDECMQAINAGIDTVCECSINGYKLIAAGEMGIGNTTTSAALAAALLGLDVEDVTGRGAGLSNAGLEKKKQVITDALSRYLPDEDVDRTSPEFAMEMLSCVGGLDIAALAGLFIGGAIYHIPVVLDGFISAAAALAAERLAPGCRHCMIASHAGREPGMKYILDALELEPVIDAGLALGEGTGAVMLFPLLDTALSLYSDGLAFEETEVEQYEHFDEEEPGGSR
ncbi:MAG: nicotinate-nucleotide--dimethylbenzimidazole phosphoribosyltransferase [Mogibacterium sp.]|nr:nicotinate-nucleotide--dimethylbenzimidazole phosphoribosyltransferase [Mogibacterium sp.]